MNTIIRHLAVIIETTAVKKINLKMIKNNFKIIFPANNMSILKLIII